LKNSEKTGDLPMTTANNNVQWAQKFGGTLADVGWGITTDKAGNTYLTGTFQGSANFGSTTLNNTFTSVDAFVAKLDSAGQFVWAQKLGGVSEDFSYGITTDDASNIYLTGFFSGSAVFGNTTLTSEGPTDAFVTKLDSTGKFLWAKNLGGTISDSGYGITTDKSGNVYVSGVLNTTQNPPANINSLFQGDNAFITKLDSNGNVLWTKTIDGTSSEKSTSVTTDQFGNIYATGLFNGTAVFDNVSLTTTGNIETFITKLDNNGQFLWAQRIAGTSLNSGNAGFSISADAVGNTYVAGAFSGSVTIGGNTLTSAGGEDVFVTKLDSNGNLLWAKSYGGNGDDNALSIIADKSGNLYVNGGFSGTANFDNITLTSAGDFDIFTTKLDTNGNVLSAQRFGGTSNDIGLGITIDGVGNAYATGLFFGNVSFGDTTLNSTGDADGFIVKLASSQLNQVSNTNNVFNLSGSATPLQFVLKSVNASVVNEIGIFTVDDAQGTIDGIAPNSPNYTQAALARARSLFSPLRNAPNGFNNNQSTTLNLESGENFRLFLVQNGTVDGIRNGSVPLSQLVISSATSLQVSQTNGVFELGFSDSPGSSQFNNAVVQVQLVPQPQPIGSNLQEQKEGEVLDLRDFTGTLTATLTVNREAAYNNFVGFYRVANIDGSIDTDGDGVGDLLPGQAGYVDAAVKNRVAGLNLTVGNQATANFTGQFEAGAIYAPFLIVNSSLDPLLDTNPNNNPIVYFSYLGANPDKVDHVRILGNNVFGFEDLPSGGDKDFNDFIVSVNFSQPVTIV
jgi:hypothetical protein